MAEVSQHVEIWNREWDWSRRGDEWSDWWGGTDALWHSVLLPRIHAFVPTDTILEIAPGFGRWSQYLQDLADRLILVDVAESCIEGCRERFANAANIEFHVNDGRSLAMVEDGSVDFAFSFDSLVHVEADVLDSYLRQLARKLTPNGVGFFHHSNIGAYRGLTRVARHAPDRQFRRLVKRGLVIDLSAWRAESVTADRFAAICDEAGLACTSQELITWEHGPYLIDALSIFTPRGSTWERPRQRLRNRRFRWEARRASRLYAAPAPTG